ncbi:OLC1v1003579C1 [Oldenlandia corymbosa var. corymbosa]|uniref:OLC1v1003579C1 n=1 Tax=Oldenlandia corymbosa var. corymbosa TaxID=529605 RepID=A0AAV1DAC5_OLDCO|nr:OLC1v1003579C1 [Oldenlandia corymbosa var. corymbosa]
MADDVLPPSVYHQTAGACGYGVAVTSYYGSHLAAAVPSIFNDGTGCGACFQIRCKNKKLCSEGGTKVVVVTELGLGLGSSSSSMNVTTDLVLSRRAFRALSKLGLHRHLFGLGIVDIQYHRVACEYEHRNLGIRVEESSHKPHHYLAITLLFQGGQTHILAVSVAKVGTGDWRDMTRNHGAVWHTTRAPAGALEFLVVVTSGYDGKYYYLKNVMPGEWKIGVIYDTGLNLTDIAPENCPTMG